MDKRKLRELCKGNVEDILHFFMGVDKEINRIISNECSTDEQRKTYEDRKKFMQYVAAKTLLCLSKQDEYTEELKTINAIRNMRVAVLLNYRMHEKATKLGLELASQLYINSFRCYELLDEDFEKQSMRMEIYNQFLDNADKLTAIDIELMALLLFQCEYDSDEREKIFNRLKTMYIKDFESAGLGMDYTEDICEQDITLWLDFYGINSKNIIF